MKSLFLILVVCFVIVNIFSQGYTFNLKQEIFTNGANDTKYFEINGNHYLAIAAFQDNNSVEINSTILKWDSDSSKFLSFQEISTLGASDWEFFTIENDYYLAVANYRSDTSFIENSIIYKWNGNQFIVFQTIETQGAYDWEFFEIEDSSFLVIANQDNGSSNNINSHIYKWNGMNFEPFQTIPTKGATDWEAFSINENYYLAIANVYDINSTVYKWNGNQFDEFQIFNFLFATTGAEFFEIDNEYYLAFSRGFESSFSSISKIFKWNGVQFSFFQEIPSFGAFDFEYFTMKDEHYLALANYQLDTGIYSLNSEILKWNDTKFENFQNIFTHGAVDFEYFEIEDSSYLMIAEYKDSIEHNISSRLFHFFEPDTSKMDTIINEIFKVKINSFLISPNPTNNIINITQLDPFSSTEIVILNSTGKQVYSKNLKALSLQINLNKLSISKGSYYFNITTKKKSFHSKVIYH